MFSLRLHPTTQRRIAQFKRVKRGYWSLWALVLLLAAALTLELWVSHRALVVSYQGRLYFPSYGAMLPGKTFGLGY